MKKHMKETKQIAEAIVHYNALVSALINEFGKDIVFSKEFNYTLNLDDLKKIFNILNKHLFGNMMKKLPVVLWPINKLIDKLNYHAKMSGEENKPFKDVRCLGVHTAICAPIIDENNKLVDVKLRDNYMIINSSDVHDNIFIFVVATICHEMIHAYDYQHSSEIHDMVLEWEKHHKEKPRFHETTIFGEKMKEANENSVHVVTMLSSDPTYKIDNIEARYVLKDIIGENEDDSLVVRQSNNDLLMMNKKTGYGFFVHFD